MRIRVFSDLHLEFAPFVPPPAAADVVVLAGDIAVGTDGVTWARSTFPDRPVVYVLGNHEYYGARWPDLAAEVREAAAGTNVHVLDDDHVRIGGVDFVGATLWTDLALYGNAAVAASALVRMLHDYQAITVSPQGRRLYPADTARVHRRSLRWMEALLPSLSGPIVVVSHHAPSPRSLDARFGDHISNCAYASRLEGFVTRHRPALWIHGHIHTHRDYVLGATRVVSNPRGYPRERGSAFEAAFVVEVPTQEPERDHQAE